MRRALPALVVPALLAAQSLPTPQALMEKHNAAVGGRAALDKHTSIHLTATMSIPQMGDATMEVFRRKPNLYLQKVTIGPIGDITQGYDGKVGWTSDPMRGPVLLTGDVLESAKNQADFASNFQDPSAYKSAETVELTDFEGRKCYKVKLLRGTREGTEFFDATTGLLAGFISSADSPAGPIESTNVFVEYGDFGGLKFPKKIEQRSSVGLVSINFTAVEFDKVDAAVFELPAALKAPAKP